ncbi:hypothetical protein GCM10027188_29110 [Lysobacter humi (ex Lee et al. 2017)]
MLRRATYVLGTASVMAPISVWLVRPEPGSTHFAWFLLSVVSLFVGCFSSFIAFRLARSDFSDARAGHSTAAAVVPLVLLLPALLFLSSAVALLVWVSGAVG